MFFDVLRYKLLFDGLHLLNLHASQLLLFDLLNLLMSGIGIFEGGRSNLLILFVLILVLILVVRVIIIATFVMHVVLQKPEGGLLRFGSDTFTTETSILSSDGHL